MTLYHYTCDHSRAALGGYGTLRPIYQLQPGVFQTTNDEDMRLLYTLIWVTDLPEPDIEGLGLTSKHITCERWKHRYRITNELPVMRFSDMQYRFTPKFQMELLSGAAKPDHWFVSWRPLAAMYDPMQAEVDHHG